MPITTTTTTTTINADDCISALIRAEGNSAFAAEKLGITQSDFVVALASDPSTTTRLNEALRVLTVIRLFTTQQKALLLLQEQLVDMKPFDLSKTFADIAKLVTELTDAKTSNVNLNVREQTWSLMPPNIRRAMMLVLNEAPIAAANYVAAIEGQYSVTGQSASQESSIDDEDYIVKMVS